MSAGKLYGVSVGPGDPELMTLKAVRIIDEADVVAMPNIGHKRQTAYSIAERYLEGKELLDCPTPMSRDHEVAMRAYAQTADVLCGLLDASKTVAYLVLGDVTVYSSYIYIHRMVTERGYEAELVPGVTSFCAAAAKLGKPLCEGGERLLVAPVLAADVDVALDFEANKVFMKSGHALYELRDKLEARGLLEQASMVANCGLPDERVYERFADIDERDDYFSVVLVQDARSAWAVPVE